LCDYSLKSFYTLNCSDLLLAMFCGSRHYTENSIFMIEFHRSVCIFIRPYSILLIADPQPLLKDRLWSRSYWLQWVPLQTCLEILDITASRLLKVLCTVRDGIRNRRDRNECKQRGEGPGWPIWSQARAQGAGICWNEYGINHGLLLSVSRSRDYPKHWSHASPRAHWDEMDLA